MNIFLWVLQGALAWLSVAGGVYQIFKFDELSPGVAAMRALPQGLWTVLGVIGVVAGTALIVPRAFGVMPQVTAYAAVVMAVHSLVIAALYLTHGDKAPLPYVLVMAALAAFIAYGRFKLSS